MHSLEEGLADLAAWLEGQIASDRVAESRNELAARGLDGMSDPVLICGGAGFIGTNLASRLLAPGQPVLIYDDLSRPGVERNLQWLKQAYGACSSSSRATSGMPEPFAAACDTRARCFTSPRKQRSQQAC